MESSKSSAQYTASSVSQDCVNVRVETMLHPVSGVYLSHCQLLRRIGRGNIVITSCLDSSMDRIVTWQSLCGVSSFVV